MLEPMFEIPGTNIRRVNITEEVILGSKKPEYSETNSSSFEKTYQEEHDSKERAVNP